MIWKAPEPKTGTTHVEYWANSSWICSHVIQCSGWRSHRRRLLFAQIDDQITPRVLTLMLFMHIRRRLKYDPGKFLDQMVHFSPSFEPGCRSEELGNCL